MVQGQQGWRSCMVSGWRYVVGCNPCVSHRKLGGVESPMRMNFSLSPVPILWLGPCGCIYTEILRAVWLQPFEPSSQQRGRNMPSLEPCRCRSRCISGTHRLCGCRGLGVLSNRMIAGCFMLQKHRSSMQCRSRRSRQRHGLWSLEPTE